MSDEILPCPCGKQPSCLGVEEGSSRNYSLVHGDCCGDWMIEFRSDYKEGTELGKQAREAWNKATRPKKQ